MARKGHGPSALFVQELSRQKSEPAWMTQVRLSALDHFYSLPLPTWGPNLSALAWDDIRYFVRPPVAHVRTWAEVPTSIQQTFDYLGLPHAERAFLAGLGVQYESELLYSSLQAEWAARGVIFTDMDTAVREYPDLVRTYFGTLVHASDNKFSALNTALWSGGSFVYVPKGVVLDKPVQAYFRINAERLGQFERTLIIAENGSQVQYIEGCSAPVYSTQSLHCGVVEVFAQKKSQVRYTTIQNWSSNVYNLVTKRARASEHAVVEWIDGNIGSAITMKYPSVILQEHGARATLLSLSFAGAGQQQDSGGAMIHQAADTHSFMLSKSISKHGGSATFRGKIVVESGAHGVTARSQCDALLLDAQSSAAAYPDVRVSQQGSTIGHEGSVSALDSAQLFYLMARGLSRQRAYSLMVNGFVHACVAQIPAEYAVELQLLLEREMEGL